MGAKENATQRRDSDQIRAFRKAAKELGCDDSEDRFKAALRAVGKAKQPEKFEKKRSVVTRRRVGR